MIHADTDTSIGIGLVPIPGIFTNDIPGICIDIGTIPILELIQIPIPILFRHPYLYRYWYRYWSIPIPGISGTLIHI